MDWTGLPVGEILHVVRGLSPVSAGAVDELAALRRAIQGEVLVAAATSSTFNVVLPLIGALVTERGGALSHAAIVAREYGLPGVVGCPGAVAAIKTGMRVRVDGATGEVWTAV
jgi:pyruvate,water dikinase